MRSSGLDGLPGEARCLQHVFLGLPPARLSAPPLTELPAPTLGLVCGKKPLSSLHSPSELLPMAPAPFFLPFFQLSLPALSPLSAEPCSCVYSQRNLKPRAAMTAGLPWCARDLAPGGSKDTCPGEVLRSAEQCLFLSTTLTQPQPALRSLGVPFFPLRPSWCRTLGSEPL